MSTENPNRLAVGYLATPSGNDGVALASAIAAKIGAALDLICVIRPIPYDGQPGLEQYMERLENQASEWLAEGAARVPEGIEVRTVVTVNESFTEGLVEVAEQSGASMIIIGGTGDGIFSRHSLGTVSTELLHSSPIPVGLAPRGYTKRKDVVIDMLTVAVSTKHSDSDPLPFSIGFAELASIDLRLLSLVSLEIPGADDESLAVRKQQVQAARTLLEETRDHVDADLDIEVLVADGNTLDEALANLPWDDNDIIAVGSGHLGSENRVFLGPTAARILKWTTAPVIVVPRSTTE
ncbi:universal stress protein [Gordonia otitidis]|uniref:UspA domain-containing protein n=1 Tax=Gordonia otitidis (strain DSM 44809 / CCUG 52243 / JCM 12355 / NBRC 100426 / IFM 10032) TaxID=1108044 RepID=H5TT81_GORO1|nr:universal stress protein [Gordonia otitidis]GAB36689.1 hypothetical protein GOOTI_233_00070 [Gordonia otitidis NBRC 100426]